MISDGEAMAFQRLVSPHCRIFTLQFSYNTKTQITSYRITAAFYDQIFKRYELVTAACALAAGMAMAQVQSANTVGFASPNAAANLNFYVPQFFDVGYNTTSIQSIQLDDGGTGVVGMGDSMQIVGPFGNPAAAYAYFNFAYFGGTGFYWTDESFLPVEVSFDQGDGFAIDNASSFAFAVRTSGEVPTSAMSFAAASNLNWTGNPFPQSISIQDVQLDDGGAGVVGMGDSMQIVGPFGNPAAAYAYFNFAYFGGTGFYWTDESFQPVEVAFAPGQGFAIDNASGFTFDIKIACPYTL